MECGLRSLCSEVDVTCEGVFPNTLICTCFSLLNLEILIKSFCVINNGNSRCREKKIELHCYVA